MTGDRNDRHLLNISQGGVTRLHPEYSIRKSIVVYSGSGSSYTTYSTKSSGSGSDPNYLKSCKTNFKKMPYNQSKRIQPTALNLKNIPRFFLYNESKKEVQIWLFINFYIFFIRIRNKYIIPDPEPDSWKGGRVKQFWMQFFGKSDGI